MDLKQQAAQAGPEVPIACAPPEVYLVGLPIPRRHPFEYLPEAGQLTTLSAGTRVLVPFGQRQLVGVVIGGSATPSVSRERLRPIQRALDDAAILPAPTLALCHWVAAYYHAPVGEVLTAALPVRLRTARAPRVETAWFPTSEAWGLGIEALSRAPRQADALQLLKHHGHLDKSRLQELALPRSALKALERKGLARQSQLDGEPGEAPGQGVAAETAQRRIQLNHEQQHALDLMQSSLGQFSCTLLEGVTGSGKTEVYLRTIESVLARGQQVLVLIPEIGLTPQAQHRYTARFGEGVEALHSGLSDGARLRIWQAARLGRLRILIGTRSAIFTPMPRLGLVIVDEEHDASYKQQEGFRYSARDVAVYRAQQENIPALLGSATPSTDSLQLALSGRYRHRELTERAGCSSLPDWQLVDIRQQDLDSGFATATLAEIGTELNAGNQVLVFLNRRGWSPVLMCHDCGWTARCNACDARLTLHRQAGRLWCHHCDRRHPPPSQCPECKSNRLLTLGQGTEKCEHLLTYRFPNSPVRRIDRSTTQRRSAMAKAVSEIEQGVPMILVGTQMLAKGHHFPNVTLVVVLEADAGLFGAEYRATERTAQLLEQVAGRAGRAQRPGRVLVQTHHPANETLGILAESGYRALVRQILLQRKLASLPPFQYLALLWFEGPRAEDGPRLLGVVQQALAAAHPEVNIIGPIPAPMHRRAGRFRDQLIFQAHRRRPLHQALADCCTRLEHTSLPSNSRWILDVDPLDGV